MLSLPFLQRLAVFPPKEYKVHVLITSNDDLCQGFPWHLTLNENAIVCFFLIEHACTNNNHYLKHLRNGIGKTVWLITNHFMYFLK